MSSLQLFDNNIHYEDIGVGKPVLFLHSWLGSWRYWIPSMQSASISYRAYSVDLWGFGESTKEKNLYMLDSQIVLIDQFISRLNIGKVAIVGHGLGALLALLFAIEKPYLVNRVMGIALPIKQNNFSERLGSKSISDLAESILGIDASMESIRTESNKTDPLAISHSISEINNLDVMAILKDIRVPYLMVHGEDDPIIHAPQFKEFGEYPSNSHHILFENSGHFPMLDRKNKFHRLMNDFLDLKSNESPQQLQLKEEWQRRVR